MNAQDNQLDSPLLLAGAAGHLEILKLALKAGPNFKLYNRYGGTALIPACERGHVEVVEESLKTEIDINHVNRLGWTAFSKPSFSVMGDRAIERLCDCSFRQAPTSTFLMAKE